jgi:hypothetical protein
MDVRQLELAYGPLQGDPQSTPAPGGGVASRKALALVAVLVILGASAGYGIILLLRYEDANTVREGAHILINAKVAMKGVVTVTIDRWTPAEKEVFKGTFSDLRSTGGVTVPLEAGNHTMFVEANFAYVSKNSYPSVFEVLPGRVTEVQVEIVAGS